MSASGTRGLGVDSFVKALGLMAAGLVLFVLALVQMALFYRAAGGFGQFVLASVAAVSVLPFYTGLILLLDRHEKEPGWLLLGALLWGGVVAVFLSLWLNEAGEWILQALVGPQLGSRLTAPLIAPPVEETSKGLAVLLIFLLWRREFTNTVDGLVYGALTGLGFAVTENILYFARFMRQGGLALLTLGFVVRAVLGGFGHSVYTACTGAGLGYSREAKGAARFVAPVAGYFGAMFLHFLWNFSASFILPAVARSAGAPVALLLVPVMSLFLEGIPLVLLLVIAYFAWKREVLAIREGLAGEVEAGRLTPDDVEVLTRPRERRRRLWAALSSKGLSAWNALRQLYDTRVDLAFSLWRAKQGEPVAADVQALRERLSDLEQRAREAGVLT